MDSDQRIYEGKEVAYYSSLVNAWLQMKIEKDKHLLSLSTAGIGLLVTLATAVGVGSIYSASMFLLAVLSFVFCIGIVLYIFEKNAEHLEAVIKSQSSAIQKLNLLDRVANFLFIIGIIFTLLVGVFSVIDGEIKGASSMADVQKIVNQNPAEVKKSVDKVENLAPQKPAPKPAPPKQQEK